MVVSRSWEGLMRDCQILSVWLAKPRQSETLAKGGSLPEISRFFGIVIRMFVEAGAGHHRPHFHAYCQNQTGVVAVDEIEMMAGSLPKRQERLVLAWAELHRDELMSNWELLQSGRPPVAVPPLR
jgi:hypothetical protein